MNDRVKIEMVYCYIYWLNPSCELDRNIVAGIWKYATRLKQWYTKYERHQDAVVAEEMANRMIGAYDNYIATQVSGVAIVVMYICYIVLIFM